MKERIREIMESKGMTQQVFSQFLEMSPASLSSILTGRTNPTLNIVDSIKKKISNINIEWLMYGNGNMLLEDNSSLDNKNCSEENSDFHEGFNPQKTSSDSIINAECSSEGMQSCTARDISQMPSSDIPNKGFADMKIFNKNIRKIKEIRVFYDDQTYESFVPKE